MNQKLSLQILTGLGIAVLVGFVFFLDKLVIRKPENVQTPVGSVGSDTDNGKDLSAITSFPFFTDLRSIIVDPEDTNVFWLAVKGGILKYNSKTKQYDEILDGLDGIIESPISLARKGDFLFYGYQGGFMRVNLSTKEVRSFTIKNGLVNGSNIVLADDLYTDDLWIATFNGISRHNLKSESFENFTNEIGLGSWWSAVDITVDEKYVWARIIASAYSVGGIARYDKVKKIWESWDPATFGRMDRVDFDGFTGSGQTAFASIDNRIYQFDYHENKWKVILEQGDENTTFRRGLVYLDNKLFFQAYPEGQINYLDLHSLSIKTLIEPASALGTDEKNGKLLLIEWPARITVYDPFSGGISRFPLPDTPGVLEIISVLDDLIIFEKENHLTIYNFSRETFHDLEAISTSGLDRGSFTAKLMGGLLFIVKTSVCDYGGCSDGKMYTVSIEDYRVRTELTLSDYYFEEVALGDSPNEIFLISERGVKQYDESLEFFKDSNISLEIIQSTYDNYDYYQPVVVHNKAGSLSVRLKRGSQTGDQAALEIKVRDSDWARKEFTVGEPPYNPFGHQSRAVARYISFDDLNQGLIWIGSDRGLILYDVGKDSSRLFTNKNGLVNNYVNKVFSMEDLVIIDHGLGVYIYKTR